jgi:septum formation topological specificity factor MinE
MQRRQPLYNYEQIINKRKKYLTKPDLYVILKSRKTKGNKKMKLTLKEMLIINHKRYNAYRKGLKKMDTEELKVLAAYYESENYTWTKAYARAARIEMATR